jgi:hypothetical protein
MLKSGKVEYPVRQITAEERNNAIQLLQVKLDLLPEEAAQAFDLLKSGFETVAKDIAQSHIKNGLMTEQSKRENKKMVTEARSVFLKFGQFNKNLQFKETDPNKFWIEETNEKGEIVNRLNEKHPEVEGFKKYMLPVMEALVKSDIRYSQILKMAKEFGEDAVYTFAAKKLGLPVAINTEDRDKKLLNSGVRKALKPFLAGNASEELPVDGSGKIPGARKDKASNDSGIDINRLIDDEQYYDSVMRQKPGDLAHADYVSELADKALRLRRKQGK